MGTWQRVTKRVAGKGGELMAVSACVVVLAGDVGPVLIALCTVPGPKGGRA